MGKTTRTFSGMTQEPADELQAQPRRRPDGSRTLWSRYGEYRQPSLAEMMGEEPFRPEELAARAGQTAQTKNTRLARK